MRRRVLGGMTTGDAVAEMAAVWAGVHRSQPEARLRLSGAKEVPAGGARSLCDLHDDCEAGGERPCGPMQMLAEATCRVTPAHKCTGVLKMHLNGTQSAQRGHKLKLGGRSLNVARLNGRIGVTIPVESCASSEAARRQQGQTTIGSRECQIGARI